ncbi:polysaccharide biosynthesis protein [Taibaiella soli]|uniref:Polysaccharide biosynthesis protein n=1 Tax=Taibaiella soli TaxID=1649169 RepID=A0A2W2BHQ9_9BACT|nr:polysaccharide biosynthesis protein [Taibaiella soli]
MYSCISLANILFTYGMETAFFRFASSGEDKEKLFRTSFGSLLLSTIVLSIICVLLRKPMAHFVDMDAHPEYITWCVIVIALDALSTIPFARLRQQGRPKKYAAIRFVSIFVNLAFVIFFIYFSQKYAAAHPEAAYSIWYNSHSAAGLLVLANVAQSAVTFILLFNEWKDFRFPIDKELWLKLWNYASPMIIVGLGGMVNETVDRIMLLKLNSHTVDIAKSEVGIYNANYKIAIFITLFIQAFRMGAEPFFFNQAADKNAPKTYARVMKWFAITVCLAFLFTGLFLDVWKYMVGPAYRSGLGVVPILLFANVCLGIYYNLSVWYKITDNMRKGMYITLIGAAITFAINFAFVPTYGMYACAWATCICYFAMMIMSYFWGQKYFFVPYATKKILSYMVVMLLLFAVQRGVSHFTHSFALRLTSGIVLMGLFLLLVLRVEKEEMKKMPFIGKYIK